MKPLEASSKLQRAKGATRNFTPLFQKAKHAPQHEPENNRLRFQPLKSNFLMSLSQEGQGSYSGVSSPQETEKLTGENIKFLPGQSTGHRMMVTKASSGDGDDLSDSGLEYGKRFLPPLWVDLQEEIEAHISEITTKSNPSQADLCQWWS